MQRQPSPQVGEMAPDFQTQTQQRDPVRLSDYRGKRCVVLVFYPGDDTPLCTSQLCAFRDSWEGLQTVETEVFGVNPSSESRHVHFVQKHGFPFSLLMDRDKAICSAYGRLALLGLLVKRGVFLIDKAGKIAQIWEGNPPPSAILEAIKSLPSTPSPQK